MSRRAPIRKPEKLDPMKRRKIGPPQKRSIVVDLTGIPEDLIAAVLDSAPDPAARRAAAAKGSAQAAANAAQRRQARAAAHQAIHDEPGVYRRSSGAGERILAAAGEWITTAELRAELGIGHGLVTRNVDRLWQRGDLEKRLNPGRAENPKRATGAAACEFQYRRAQKEPAP